MFMKHLTDLSDHELHLQTRLAAMEERDSTLKVLYHLREVERRMAYAQEYPSMHEYCMLELGYDKSSAHHRVTAMRLLREMPELAPRIETGELSLTSLSQAQSFFRKEKIKDLDRKHEVMEAIKGLSTREIQREFIHRAEIPERHVPERVRVVSDTHVEVRILADQGFMDDLRALCELLGMGSVQEVLSFALHEAVQKRRSKGLVVVRPRDEGSKTNIERQVFERDEDQCTYVSPTGNRCRIKSRLELDHIIPKAKGGVFSVDNLRLRCRTHNQLAAVESFGAVKMAEHLPKLRH